MKKKINKPVLFRFDDRLSFRVDERTENSWGYENESVGIDLQDCAIDIRHKQKGSTESLLEQRAYSVHFHCAKHPRNELVHNEKLQPRGSKDTCFVCSECEDRYYWVRNLSYEQIEDQAIAKFNSHLYRDIVFKRIDDEYVPELRAVFQKDKVEAKLSETIENGYKIQVDIKKDKNGAQILMLQIFKDGFSKGAQFFIKPETGQVTYDHVNPNPKDFISGITIKFKDGHNINQEFEKGV